MQQTNTHFSHTLGTLAPPARIWQLWSDVPNWPRWDNVLKTAKLNGPFATGTSGMVIPDRGLRAHFTLTDVVPGQTYTIRTKLPLGSLNVKRTLTKQNGQTVFTHEVWFDGFSSGFFGWALGKRYRTILPDVMQRIKTLAEQ